MADLERKTLTEWRKARHMTQRRLAELSKTTVATIWNIEHGRNRPQLETAQSIADALEILVDQIIWPAVVPFPSRANRGKKPLPAAA